MVKQPEADGRFPAARLGTAVESAPSTSYNSHSRGRAEPQGAPWLTVSPIRNGKSRATEKQPMVGDLDSARDGCSTSRTRPSHVEVSTSPLPTVKDVIASFKESSAAEGLSGRQLRPSSAQPQPESRPRLKCCITAGAVLGPAESVRLHVRKANSTGTSPAHKGGGGKPLEVQLAQEAAAVAARLGPNVRAQLASGSLEAGVSQSIKSMAAGLQAPLQVDRQRSPTRAETAAAVCARPPAMSHLAEPSLSVRSTESDEAFSVGPLSTQNSAAAFNTRQEEPTHEEAATASGSAAEGTASPSPSGEGFSRAPVSEAEAEASSTDNQGEDTPGDSKPRLEESPGPAERPVEGERLTGGDTTRGGETRAVAPLKPWEDAVVTAAGTAFLPARVGVAAASSVEYLASRCVGYATWGVVGGKGRTFGVAATGEALVDGAEAAAGVVLGVALGAFEGGRLVWHALRH